MKRKERVEKLAGVLLAAVILLMACSASLKAADFFSDGFAGPDLDPRWTTDNSPANIANNPDSTIKILSGIAVGQPTYANTYNHIQTLIDASINFVVQADVRNNYGNTWGPGVVVYWSPGVFVSLKAPAGTGTYFQSFVSDGVNYTTKASTVVSGGWDMATLRIEFESDTIKFYAKGSADPSLYHLSTLDIPRVGVFKNPSAILIVGKGHQSPDYTNPDYDNDYGDVGNADSIMIDNVIYHPLPPVPRNYFNDTFDGPELNARWKLHNSPTNINEPEFAGMSDIAIVNSAAQASPTYANCYNHIETDIDAGIDFAVQADVRSNNASSWGPAVVVYWDPKTFVSIKAPVNGFFCTFVGDGSQMAVTNSAKTYGGWDLATVRIEFLSDTIKFYAKSSSDTQLFHLSTLDITRTAAFKKPYAVMVVGKGYQGFGTGYAAYMNPDYNNDYTGGPGSPTSPDVLIIDNAIYEPLGTYECGDPGTVYLDADLNHDCKVDLKDVAMFAQQWGWCSEPTNAACDQYWLNGSTYFVDNFDYVSDPTPLNPRWKSDNSPLNPAGTDLTIVNWLGGVAQSNGQRNLYNHIETPIDATGDFVVDCNMMGNSPSSWAPSLMVYWDTTHWIRFAQFDYYGLMYNDGSTSYNIPSYMLCGGWDFFVQRIEFGSSTIKFYATTPGYGSELFNIPDFDIPRGTWTKAAGAKLIVGKGYQGWGYNNPDFDNDYVEHGGENYLGIDSVSYQPLNVTACTSPGAIHFAGDLNTDCQVNMKDVAIFVGYWLKCTDPAIAACDQFWNP